jgi:hypothetical protein
MIKKIHFEPQISIIFCFKQICDQFYNLYFKSFITDSNQFNFHYLKSVSKCISIENVYWVLLKSLSLIWISIYMKFLSVTHSLTGIISYIELNYHLIWIIEIKYILKINYALNETHIPFEWFKFPLVLCKSDRVILDFTSIL